ncbi:unnamed protein product [Danaus chrysippus]|uniref:26S proteasome non-ATPase regulatory subunit 5 n=1 Tax=Danaus chrysippus TaxID=151541 RepID=A0A8J2QCK1_9NEOP|nr:unnamed protein product [Danaus chrysippus]
MSNRDLDQLRNCLDRLKIKENIPTALNEIKSILAYKPAAEAAPTIRNVGISKILFCINKTTKSEAELACDVLKICFDKFEPGEAIRSYISHFMYLLRHERDCVRRLAVDEVYKAITSNVNALPLPQYIDVFVAVAQMICDVDIGIANKAVLITSNLPTEAYPKVLEEMKIALDCNNSAKCNAYEVVMNISSKSYDLFQLCAQERYIDFMVNELNSDDILYQLNILELLSQLAVKPHGINYLVKQGMLQKIADQVKELHSNPFGSLLTPGYMKFFGYIAYHYPKEIFGKYPILLETLFEALDSDDSNLLPVAIDTLGFIGTTIEGKMCLATLGSKYTQNIERLGAIIRNSPSELRIRALRCMGNLISVDKDPNSKVESVDQRITLMTREWFRILSKQPSSMEVLYGICKNPFPDIKLAGLILLDATCQHQWGEELVSRVAGFIEYLLDRTTDFNKECNEAKYDIIKRLASSTAFDKAIIIRLQKYVELGPFYSETTLEVAMDGE